MKRLLLTSILLLALVLPTLQAAHAWDEEATRLAYSLNWDQGVVVVLNHRDREYGTGWFIHPRYVVTAKHVIGDASNTAIEVVKGSFRTGARVVALDDVHDVVILELERPYSRAHIFPLRAAPKKGEAIYVIGFPYELAILQGYDWGRISMNPRAARGTASWYDERRMLVELGTYTDAGNSGGPVVDEEGNAIGLVTFALRGEAATMYFATSAEKVIRLCQEHGIPYTPAPESMAASGGGSGGGGPADEWRYAVLGAGATAIAALGAVVAARRR